MMSDLRSQQRAAREESKRTEERYAAALPGWKPSTAKDTCPRVVAGKRCRRGYGAGHGCVCYSPQLLDHVRMWVTPKGQTVLTAAPYHIDHNDLNRLIDDCGELGLKAWVEFGEAPYGFGTYFLIIAKRDEDESVRGQIVPPDDPHPRADELWTPQRPNPYQEIGMPRTQIFKHGEDVSVVTTASDERDFIETFTQALKPLMKNGTEAREQREAVRAGFDIVAKLRGYKSDVQERRVLAAGRWPHPSETPVSEAGEDAEAED